VEDACPEENALTFTFGTARRNLKKKKPAEIGSTEVRTSKRGERDTDGTDTKTNLEMHRFAVARAERANSEREAKP